jgi:hypothetical protein
MIISRVTKRGINTFPKSNIPMDAYNARPLINRLNPTFNSSNRNRLPPTINAGATIKDSKINKMEPRNKSTINPIKGSVYVRGSTYVSRDESGKMYNILTKSKTKAVRADTAAIRMSNLCHFISFSSEGGMPRLKLIATSMRKSQFNFRQAPLNSRLANLFAVP